LEVIAGYDIPIIYDFDCCHTHPMLTIPIVSRIRIDFNQEFVELIQSIRQRETRTSNTPMPIIALTSEEGDMLNTAIKLGVNDYLVKPVSIEGLVPKLQQLLAS
jgi:CheY-like chemotaxis protein